MQWKDIEGYKGLYKISEFGDIKSFQNSKKGKVLSKSIMGTGYVRVRLSSEKDGRTKRERQKFFVVHRLVALSFLPQPNGDVDKLHVNHIDGNKTNNHFSNLEWCTSRENCLHSTRVLGNVHPTGQDNPTAKWYKVTYPNGEEAVIFNMREFCEKNNLLDKSMNHVANGRRKTHRGFKAEHIKNDDR